MVTEPKGGCCCSADLPLSVHGGYTETPNPRPRPTTRVPSRPCCRAG